MKNRAIGQTEWAVSAGFILVKSTGKEPEFVSQDRISVLNTTQEEAALEITIYFSDDKPVGTYKLAIKAERVRSFRVNDLIFPHAIPLGVSYGCYIKSNVPVVVQFTKLVSSQSELALMGTTAYAHSEE